MKAVRFTHLLVGCLTFFLVVGCTSEVRRSEEIRWTPWRPGPVDGTITYAEPERCRDVPVKTAPPGTPYCAGIRLFLQVNGQRREMRVADAANRRTGEEGGGRPFAVSGDGRRLVYFSGRLRRYVSHDLPTGHSVELRDMENISVSDDGDLVAFAVKGKIHITDVESNRTFRLRNICELVSLGTVIVGQTCGDEVRFLAFNRKGKRVGAIRWSALLSSPNRGALSPDGKRAVAVYANGFGGDHDVLVIRDAGTAKVLKLVSLPSNGGYWHLVRVSGSFALVYSNGTYRVVDFETGAIHETADRPDLGDAVFGLPVRGKPVPPVTLSEKPPALANDRIATAYLTLQPAPWQLGTVTGQRIPVPQSLPSWGMFAISRDGRWIVYGRQSDMRLVAQHLPSNRVVVSSGVMDPEISSYAPAIYFAPGDRYLAFQEQAGSPIQVTELETGRKTDIAVRPNDSLTGWQSSSLVVSRSGLRDKTRLLSPAGKPLHGTVVHDEERSPDGKRRFRSDYHGEPVQIIDVATKRSTVFTPKLPDGWMLDYAIGWASNEDLIVGMWRLKDGNNWGYAVVNLTTGKVRVLPSQDPRLEIKTIVFGDVS